MSWHIAALICAFLAPFFLNRVLPRRMKNWEAGAVGLLIFAVVNPLSLLF